MNNENSLDPKKKRITGLVRGLLPNPTSNLSGPVEADPHIYMSPSNLQQDRERSGFSKLIKSMVTLTQTTSTSAQLQGSLDTSTVPSQRTFSNRRTVHASDQVAFNPRAFQANSGNVAPGNASTQRASPVPIISNDSLAAQDGSIVPSRFRSEIAMPPVSTILHHDENINPAQLAPVVAVPTDLTTILLSDRSDAASAKDNLEGTGKFIEVLITKIPNVVGTNFFKAIFNIAKVVIDIKKTTTGNMDMLERRILSTAEELEFMESTVGRWGQQIKEQKIHFKRLNDVFQKEMENLVHLDRAGHDVKSEQITGIFERLNEARIQFGLAINFRFSKAAHAIEANQERILLSKLRVSKLPGYEYHLGSGKEIIRRAVCTPGTRERLLNEIVTWAKDASSQTIYWLFGPAGTGKTTIACTIARRFEMATSEDIICLGGNFFSSQQFKETRSVSRIVSTIVYHLALRCKPFADALIDSNFDAMGENVRAQLDGLLVGPWLKSEPARLAGLLPQYLIVIDALDEIEGTGGSDFLHDLCNTINENHLSGLKFFATSWPDPRLKTSMDIFTNKQLCHSEDISLQETGADIKIYLNVNLPYAAPKFIDNVVTSAAGLFIYASTIIKYVGKYIPQEQNILLEKLYNPSEAIPLKQNATALLDNLYRHILLEVFGGLDGMAYICHRQILFTVVCTPERISASMAEQFLTAYVASPGLDLASEIMGTVNTKTADSILRRFDAMFYAENNQILWHHKSFPDYLFDHNRSATFWCNKHKHNQTLLDACFDILKAGLKFNIAGIESSYMFDSSNSILPMHLTKTISPTLNYACRTWNIHLSFVVSLKALASFCEVMTEFLQLQVLFWIEAMNLLRLSKFCGPMLIQASQHIEKIDPELANQLIEAANFANYFCASPAALSTPHLYLSSLSTWPGNLEPCKKWKDFFPRIPAFKSKLYSSILPLLTIEVGSKVNSVTFSPDNTHIVSGSWATPKSVKVWDLSTGKQTKDLLGHAKEVTSVAYSADGTHIIAGSHDKKVGVWEASGKKIRMLPLNGDNGHITRVTSVAFSPDGTHIASGSLDESVRIWNVSTGTQLRKLDHTDHVNCVAFSPDSRHIVSGSADGLVYIWDISNGQQVTELCGHNDWITSVAFSPNGKHIVSGSYDNSVQMYDALTGQQLLKLQGHTEGVTSVSFSPDSNYIVSGSKDKSVRIWDASTGEQIHMFQGHTDSVTSVAFAPDGLHIASGSHDQSIRVWSIIMQPQYIRQKKQHPTQSQQAIYTGWLLSPDASNYLMFVPLDISLPDNFNIITLAHSPSSSIDFIGSTLGPEWFKCYKPE